MKLFEKIGKIALGSRLGLLTDKITDDVGRIYGLYRTEFLPKWFPVFFTLFEEGEQTITEIAEYTGCSQPSVTKVIKEMVTAGLCENLKSADKRINKVRLTEKGVKLSEKFKTLYLDIDAAIENMLNETRHNFWEALKEWEFLLEKKSFLKRVQEQKNLRENKDVQIVAYEEKYQQVFKSLNEEWISAYFEMEETDYKILDNPKEYILDEGGKIFVALYHGEPIGVCALIKTNDGNYDYEMVKMAVSPKAQGLHIGWLLAKAVVNAAIESGASKLYLESNTVLKPAISLYEKIGFKKIMGLPSPYKRVNIQMELNLASIPSDEK